MNIAVIGPGSVIDLTVARIRVVNPFAIYQDKGRRWRDINEVTHEGRSAIDEYRQIAGIELELLDEVRRIIGVTAHRVLRNAHARHLQILRIDLSGADIESVAA